MKITKKDIVNENFGKHEKRQWFQLNDEEVEKALDIAKYLNVKKTSLFRMAWLTFQKNFKMED